MIRRVPDSMTGLSGSMFSSIFVCFDIECPPTQLHRDLRDLKRLTRKYTKVQNSPHSNISRMRHMSVTMRAFKLILMIEMRDDE